MSKIKDNLNKDVLYEMYENETDLNKYRICKAFLVYADYIDNERWNKYEQVKDYLSEVAFESDFNNFDLVKEIGSLAQTIIMSRLTAVQSVYHET